MGDAAELDPHDSVYCPLQRLLASRAGITSWVTTSFVTARSIGSINLISCQLNLWMYSYMSYVAGRELIEPDNSRKWPTGLHHQSFYLWTLAHERTGELKSKLRVDYCNATSPVNREAMLSQKNPAWTVASTTYTELMVIDVPTTFRSF